METRPVQNSRRLSKSLFFLTAYSLTGAALMGSSIGLVVYQSRQLFFLGHSDLLNPYQMNSGPFGSQYHDPYLTSNPGPPPPPPPLHNCPPPPHLDSIWSFFLSTWMPVAVWLSFLIICSVSISARQWIPRRMLARTGILTSQFIFGLFWVILGAIQEVQEQLLGSGGGNGQRNQVQLLLDEAEEGVDPILEAMEDSTSFDRTFEAKERIQDLIIPLGIVWYLAVALLGVGTGMLTASSSQMERQLEAAHDEAKQQEMAGQDEEEEIVGLVLLQDKEKLDQYSVEQEQVQARQPTTTTTTTTTAKPKMQYPGRQRIVLLGLILFLFLSQMKMFRWILAAQASTFAVSSCLTWVGLLSGALMISLGAKFLPRIESSS